MDPAQHAALTQRFVAWADRTHSVVALVGVGSTSGERPADRWSDHDLLIVTTDSHEAARLRRDPAHLPLPEEPMLAFAEPDHGLTVVLSDGHLLELAICGPDELEWFAADRHRVLVDRIGVSGILGQALRRNVFAPLSTPDEIQSCYQHLVKELIVVICRLGRGERISAHRHLQAALDDLLVLLQRSGRIGTAELSDPCDPARRLERTDPQIAARIDAARSVPLEDAVTRVLGLIAEQAIPICGEDAPTLHAKLEWLLDNALRETASPGV